MSKKLKDMRKGYKRYSKNRRIKGLKFYFTKARENRTEIIIGICVGLIIACIGLIYVLFYRL